ncbi:hypothetical protein VAR608DRAFT_0847 [Variovorax sp. HW608]|uniref:hypothetical protein n=1 Tax=Variovorax sp. HW608 TaxID=1034889 RepID=UPI00081FFEEE|nr:hypothetical protein [Variovorax sp. HW608]SCK14044.1 hypothetical protein VAR608DRAFT_0847 [Variovorax sp. HW608]
MFRLLSSGFASIVIASVTSAVALPAAAAAKQDGCTPSAHSGTVAHPMPVDVPVDKLTQLPANSSLVTQPAADLRSAEWTTGANTFLALVPAQDDQPRRAAGLIASGPDGTRATWLPAGADRGGDSWDLHVLERLYQFILQKDPVQDFRFDIGAQQAPRTGSRTQAAILAAIARARNCVVRSEAASATANAVSWEVVDVSPLRKPSLPVEVAVRASIAGRPVADSQVTFARGLHLFCIAKTDRRGVAKCTLSELHEDDGADEDQAAPVVATFGGAVSPTKIQLPTTAVWFPPPAKRSESVAVEPGRPR